MKKILTVLMRVGNLEVIEVMIQLIMKMKKMLIKYNHQLKKIKKKEIKYILKISEYLFIFIFIVKYFILYLIKLFIYK